MRYAVHLTFNRSQNPNINVALGLRPIFDPTRVSIKEIRDRTTDLRFLVHFLLTLRKVSYFYMIFVVILCWARPKTKITQNKFKGLMWVYMACTKTRNTETKPSKRNHRNHWTAETTETPELNQRNQRNVETKAPEPPKKLI